MITALFVWVGIACPVSVLFQDARIGLSWPIAFLGLLAALSMFVATMGVIALCMFGWMAMDVAFAPAEHRGSILR